MCSTRIQLHNFTVLQFWRTVKRFCPLCTERPELRLGSTRLRARRGKGQRKAAQSTDGEARGLTARHDSGEAGPTVHSGGLRRGWPALACVVEVQLHVSFVACSVVTGQVSAAAAGEAAVDNKGGRACACQRKRR